MSLQHGDKLFVFFEKNKIPKKGRYSYFGNHFGTVSGFNQYIEGYILAVEAIYNEYASCDSYRNDILDTIIYPLCFNYRQIIELSIKYLYFKYSGTNDTDKVSFVKRVSHKLNKAWKEVKPFLIPLLSKRNSSIDLSLFDEFINEVDLFDADSFRMRYPIKRDLTPVHPESVKLDVIGLHSKMSDLFEMFKSLDYEIDNTIIDNTYDFELINGFKDLFVKYKSQIIKVSKALNKLAEKELMQTVFSSIQPIGVFLENNALNDSHSNGFENYVLNLSSENAFILGLLIIVGRKMVDAEIILAVNEQRKKDFSKLMEITFQQCESFLSLDGRYPNRDMCYPLFEKAPGVTSKWLNTALEEINKIV